MSKPKFEIIHRNSLDCEIGRHPIPHDDYGFPLTLAGTVHSADFRTILESLEPGDTLTFVDNEA